MVVACGPKAAPLMELTVSQFWERGTAAYEEGDWEEAIRYFDRFALVGEADPRVNQAQYYAADAHFQRGEDITAATGFARLTSDLGTSEPEWEDEREETRDRLLREYPESEAARTVQ